MNFQAEPVTINALLSVSKQYFIPRYQREFSWTKENIDELWSDLIISIIQTESGYECEDSILRLLRLLDEPEDIPMLSSQLTREILYRVLRSDYGHLLAKVAFKGSHVERVSHAIRAIKKNFSKTLTVEELAQIAGMSVSGFHAHFKTVTSMSPLQFQKQLRLIEARNLMLSKHLDATAAAYKVGYESPSQFSREYARMFGSPPRRDVSSLKFHSTSIQ